MFLHAWIRPPRHLLALFLLVTLAPAALLLVFGWRLLQQDRELQLRQVTQHREQLADLAVVSLQQSLAALTLRLDDPDSIPAAPDSTVVVVTPEATRGKLLFYPFTTTGKEASTALFADGEEMEIRDHDPTRAAAWFANLARSADPAVRAGALIRQARALRSAGEAQKALSVLARAAEIQGVAITGIPSDLFARWMECEVLEAAQRTSELKEKAAVLHADLLSRKWHLDRAAFELHESDAAKWMGGAPDTFAASDVALASAVEWLWAKWSAAPGDARSARETVLLENHQMTLLWKGDRSRLTALIAGPDYAREQWLSKLPGITLQDPAQGQVRRSAAETGLPWTVTVASSRDEAELAGSRERLWLAGLVLLALLVVAGTYLIARAATRELAVARLQSDFVAAVSHEFRTPLTSLRQLTEVLRDGRVQSDDRRQTYYDAMVRQTERLHQLVESLLDFGRMEAGRSPYRMQPLDACAWVSSVVEQFSRENAGRGYQVDLDITGTAATIAADAPALTNALWNLLENAVKYSPECRTVWVSAERDQQRLLVRVRDRGLGIPPEEQKEIFRKFVRGSGAKVLGIQGTGIGLAMVEHIVKAHGGEVRVESEPGAGSTFTMLLPCHES